MRKLGWTFKLLGLALLLAALGLTGYNLLDSERAGRQARQAFVQVDEARGDVLSEHRFQLPRTGTDQPPFYVQYPSVQMPEITVDGVAYIGTLEIPEADVALPIISSFSEQDLSLAPCRYSGSVYTNDLIICGHNYSSQFGRLASVAPGSRLRLIDCDGNVFWYVVSEMETLGADQVARMQAGDWDLTLFTCTVGGRSRLTLRCLAEEPTYSMKKDVSDRRVFSN